MSVRTAEGHFIYSARAFDFPGPAATMSAMKPDARREEVHPFVGLARPADVTTRRRSDARN